jgi:hypothetical protein
MADRYSPGLILAGLQAELAVPAIDSAANVDIADVIGNKSDTHDGTSIKAIVHTLDEHAHKPQKCYPDLANSIQLTTGAAAWADPGSFTEIVPADTITDAYDIHHIVVSNLQNISEEYIVKLYSGGAGSEVEICCVTPFKDSVQTSEGSLETQTPLLPANTRISGKAFNSSTNQRTLNVRLLYHEY